jgi:hypothetical protein
MRRYGRCIQERATPESRGRGIPDRRVGGALSGRQPRHCLLRSSVIERAQSSSYVQRRSPIPRDHDGHAMTPTSPLARRESRPRSRSALGDRRGRSSRDETPRVAFVGAAADTSVPRVAATIRARRGCAARRTSRCALRDHRGSPRRLSAGRDDARHRCVADGRPVLRSGRRGVQRGDAPVTRRFGAVQL